MSLINEALRKSARDRADGVTGPSPLTDRGLAAPVITFARPPVLLLLALGLLGGLGGGIGTYFFLSSQGLSAPVAENTFPDETKSPSLASTPAEEPPAPEPPQEIAATQEAPAPPTETPEPSVRTPGVSFDPRPIAGVPQSEPAFSPESKPVSPPPDTRNIVVPRPGVAAVESPAGQPDSANASARQRRADIHEYLESMQIGGTRMSGEDSKLLADGKVYRLHSLVLPAYGLRLHDIEAHRLTFIDDAGVKYRRSY